MSDNRRAVRPIASRALAGCALLTALGADGAAGQAPLRLDHVPVAVRDLDAAVATWRALGFSLKPGRLHANSIRNVHIKFADGSALELITATEPRDAQAAQYLEWLDRAEGAAYVALDGGPVADLADRLAAGPFRFDTATGAYFESLTFPPDGPLAHLFFIVVHARPPDLPEHTLHANGARRLEAVWLARSSDDAERRLLLPLGAQLAPDGIALPVGFATGLTLAAGSLLLVRDPSGAVGGRPVVGVTVEVNDLAGARAALPGEVRAGATEGADSRGRHLRLPPQMTHGVWLELLEPAHSGRRD